MKKLFFILCFVNAAGIACGQKYRVGDDGSAIKFTIKNFGLNVTGSFSGLEGNIIFDPGNLAAASFNVSVDASSVNTSNSSRDKHLRKEDYFDVTRHPKITFVSTKVTAKGGMFTLEGMLSIKGITKKIIFQFTATPLLNSWQFAGQFKINRKDFNVGGGSWVLSDSLTVILNVKAKK